VTTILVVADEPRELPRPDALRSISPDLVLSCGDLPFESLEQIVDVCNVPLLYVPGNHDPALGGAESFSPFAYLTSSWSEPRGPQGGQNIDGDVAEAAGVVVAGLGGSLRYRDGPNQYPEGQMRRRAMRLARRIRRRRLALDVLVTHAPPRGVGDGEDPAHRGFACFHELLTTLRPAFHVHGHIHPHGPRRPEGRVGTTRVVNAVGHRVLHLARGLAR
jgi:hypothetical protein